MFSSTSQTFQLRFLVDFDALAQSASASHSDTSVAIARLLERRVVMWFLFQQLHVKELSVKTRIRKVPVRFFLTSVRLWWKKTSPRFG